MRLRRLQVRSVERLTPAYVRVVLEGPELEGFESAAPDDHVKLFFPDAEGRLTLPELSPGGSPVLDEAARSRMRDFTPRRFDGASLTIDFALHGAGVANAWASTVKPGATLVVGGPRGSTLVPADFDWYLLAGDETALPAIARRLEELPATARVTALIEVDGEADVQPLGGPPALTSRWLFRRGTPAGEAGLLARALQELEWPPGDGFVFAAGESGEMRSVREVLQQRGQRRDWSRVTGYWKRGVADFHEGH